MASYSQNKHISSKPVDPMLATKRLHLRQPQSADIPAIFALYSDPRTQQYNPMGAMSQPQAAGFMFNRWDLHWHLHGFGIYLVCLANEPATVIGAAGLQWRQNKLFLHIQLSHTSLGQGLGRELAHALIQQAIARFGPLPIYARLPQSHPSAVALLTACGFSQQLEGQYCRSPLRLYQTATLSAKPQAAHLLAHAA